MCSPVSDSASVVFVSSLGLCKCLLLLASQAASLLYWLICFQQHFGENVALQSEVIKCSFIIENSFRYLVFFVIPSEFENSVKNLLGILMGVALNL